MPVDTRLQIPPPPDVTFVSWFYCLLLAMVHTLEMIHLVCFSNDTVAMHTLQVLYAYANKQMIRIHILSCAQMLYVYMYIYILKKMYTCTTTCAFLYTIYVLFIFSTTSMRFSYNTYALLSVQMLYERLLYESKRILLFRKCKKFARNGLIKYENN